MPMRQTDMLVSCVMVALPVPHRLPMFRRSVAGYLRQTHPRTELVIVLEARAGGIQAALADHVATLGRDDIRIVEAPSGLLLGALRNIGIREARGEILCQWDDDDLHHPERVTRQLGTIASSGRQSCYLRDVMQYFVEPRLLYWTNWTMTPASVHPGTMMCDRRAGIVYPESGEAARTGDDTAVLDQLAGRGEVAALPSLPHLYVYVTHGRNTWSQAHHRMLADRLGVSRGLLRRREALIRRGLAPFRWEGDVTLMGTNGEAFVLAAPPEPVAT